MTFLERGVMDNWMQDMVWTSVGTWMDMCLVLVFKGWNTRANGYGRVMVRVGIL